MQLVRWCRRPEAWSLELVGTQFARWSVSGLEDWPRLEMWVPTGAQDVLICAYRDGRVVGRYYHSTGRLFQLSSIDKRLASRMSTLVCMHLFG